MRCRHIMKNTSFVKQVDLFGRMMKWVRLDDISPLVAFGDFTEIVSQRYQVGYLCLQCE